MLTFEEWWKGETWQSCKGSMAVAVHRAWDASRREFGKRLRQLVKCEDAWRKANNVYLDGDLHGLLALTDEADPPEETQDAPAE